MTARPWMPMYWGDYLADTAHLTNAEHGAYMLLIAYYWQNEGLPEDDGRLARICRLTITQWKKVRPTIQEFFCDGWKHKRVEFELTESRRISDAGRRGGIASGNARRLAKQKQNQSQNLTTVERSANDQPTIREALQPQLQKKDAAPNGAQSVSRETLLPLESPPATSTEVAAPQRETEEASLFHRGKEVLGPNAGGMISRLLKAKKGNVPLARAAIELAATKQSPREYIGAVIAGGVASVDGRRMTADEAYWGSRIPGIT